MTSLLLREDTEDGVTRLSLNNGAGNTIFIPLIERLSETLAELASAPPRALVIDGGRGKLFSGGLDLKSLAPWDRDDTHGFFTAFSGMLAQIIAFPAPVIAAIHSHAIAGGFILALACDFRIVQRGPTKMGLSEADLGVPVPAGTQVLLTARSSPATNAWLSMSAELVDPERALALGVATALADDAQSEAMALATRLARKPGGGMAAAKAFEAEALAERMVAADAAHLHVLLDHWYSPTGRAQIDALLARLG